MFGCQPNPTQHSNPNNTHTHRISHTEIKMPKAPRGKLTDRQQLELILAKVNTREHLADMFAPRNQLGSHDVWRESRIGFGRPEMAAFSLRQPMREGENENQALQCYKEVILDHICPRRRKSLLQQFLLIPAVAELQ